MKKNLLKGLAVAALAMIAGYNVYQAHSETEGMSELMLANVEALASGESGDRKCISADETCIKLHPTDPSQDVHEPDARWQTNKF